MLPIRHRPSGTFQIMSKIESMQRILREEGPQSVITSGFTALGKWWRQGEMWEFNKSEYVRIDGCRIGLDDPIAKGFRDLLTMGLFERPERQAIRRFLNPTFPVIELGGCIGVVACVTNALLQNPQKHIVVEANPDAARILEMNRQRNGCQFSILKAAVGYETEFVDFVVNDANLLGSSSEIENGRKIRVPATRLMDIVMQQGFQRFSLVCDIEGTEVELVQNESALLASNAELIVMEVHEKLRGAGKIDNMLFDLQKVGFEIVFRVKDTYVLKNRNFVMRSEMQ